MSSSKLQMPNKDGLVDQSEFMAFVKHQEGKLRQVYDSIDKNRDGRLTSQELRRGAKELGFRLSSDQIRSVLNRADSNHDGQLSFDEMRSFLLLLPAVNPTAVFEALGAELVVDHAMGEATPPIEVASLAGTERMAFLAVLANKLYSGSVAGAISRTLTAPIDRLKMVMQFDAAAASEGMHAGDTAREKFHTCTRERCGSSAVFVYHGLGPRTLPRSSAHTILLCDL